MNNSNNNPKNEPALDFDEAMERAERIFKEVYPDSKTDAPVIINPEKYITYNTDGQPQLKLDSLGTLPFESDDLVRQVQTEYASVVTNYIKREIQKEADAKRTAFINRIKKTIVFAVAFILMLCLATCAVRSCTTSPPKSGEITYIGNKNSKVFHKPTCANLPMEKNRREFSSRSDAINAGYRPCQNCNP